MIFRICILNLLIFHSFSDREMGGQEGPSIVTELLSFNIFKEKVHVSTMPL